MSLSSLLKTHWYEEIKKQAFLQIKKDRDVYSNINSIIIEYCKSNSLIVSNIPTILSLKESYDTIKDQTFYIFSEDPFYHANKLTNIIHEKGLLDTTNNERSNDRSTYKGQSLEHKESIIKPVQLTRLKTVVEYTEYAIEYDVRLIATIYNIKKYKQIKLMDLIMPVEINSLLLMPPEIEIINIYYKLSIVDDYERYLAYEPLLYKEVLNRIDKGIIGGASCKDKKKDLIEVIKLSIVKNFIPKNELILLGSWAHDVITKKDICVNIDKVQVMGEMDKDMLLNELRVFINKITKFNITYREQELHIPRDFRTKRITYYIKLNSERGSVEKPFLDLFNCAEFDIIPCCKVKDTYIAHKWIQLRFLFIDLWIMKMIKKLNIMSNENISKKNVLILKLIEFFRSDTQQLLDLFKFITYKGSYVNYNIDKKMQNLQTTMYHPYYPEIYMKNNNMYREIRKHITH